jgi:cell division protein FtsQ
MATRRTRPSRARRPAAKPARAWRLPMMIGALLLLGAGGVSLASHLLSQPGSLPLRVIEIKGELHHLDRMEIQQVVEETIDGGFFTCDMNALRMAVVALPWVEEVSVRRHWPDRLSMTVTEQVPLARWSDDALINVGAEVFRPQSIEPFSALVGLSGPQGSEPRVVALYQHALAEASSRGLELREVRLDQRRHWWLRFDDELVVSLGNEAIEARLAQFFRVYPTLTVQLGKRPARIDMRYSHGFAVRWHEQDGQEESSGSAAAEEKA